MTVQPVPFFSSALYARKLCFVYLPPGYGQSERAYPVVYLLHGLYGGAADWAVRAEAPATLERLIAGGLLRECIAVMPDDGGYGHGTFYTDWYDGTGNFEQYITSDLTDFIDNHFRALKTRQGRAVCGFSMGGFGAVSLALRFPHLYGAAASLAGALGSPAHLPYKDFARSEFPRMLGPAGGPYAAERDIYRLAARRAADGTAPALYFDCGVDDSLFPMNEAFHSHLDAIGLPHAFHRNAGGHTWDYWTGHLENALRFVESHWADNGIAAG